MIVRRQYIVFGAILLIVLAIMSFVYFAFFRANYVPLFKDLRESDASAIVAELDSQSIEYQLANGGKDILVPEEKTGQARLALAGSSVALGGVVGFELFNESDMGLTEFAQKINYQRALQGELARTIMMMDGVENARVHLALPERSIFKAAQSQPTAAVTIQTIGKTALARERVAGIQQLVASAVPDLALGRVAILDEQGDLLSELVSDSAVGSVAGDEKSALEQYFRARAQSAIAQIMPGLRNEVKVLATKKDSGSSSGVTLEQQSGQSIAPKSGNARDFRLRVLVRTPAALSGEDSALLRAAIIEALALKPDDGDYLEFEIGSIGFRPGISPALPTDEILKSGSAASADGRFEKLKLPWMDYVFNRWFVLFIGFAATVGVLFWRQRPRLNEDEQQSFADLLNEGLSRQQATRNAD